MIEWAFYDCEQSGPSWCHWSKPYSGWSGENWNSDEDLSEIENETWCALDIWHVSNSESWNLSEEYYD